MTTAIGTLTRGFRGRDVTPEQAEVAYDTIGKIIERGMIYKTPHPTVEQVQQYRRIVTRFNCMEKLDLHDERELFINNHKAKKEKLRQDQRYTRITEYRVNDPIKEASVGSWDTVVESYMIISDPFSGVELSVMNIGKEFMDTSQKIKKMGYADTQTIYKHKDPALRERAKRLNEKSSMY